jgi:acyl carrier protein
MMNEDILAQLNAYITTKILKNPARTLSADEPLLSAGVIDSFSLVDLAIFIEDTFGVHLDDMELNADAFDSLDQLAGLILARRT